MISRRMRLNRTIRKLFFCQQSKEAGQPYVEEVGWGVVQSIRQDGDFIYLEGGPGVPGFQLLTREHLLVHSFSFFRLSPDSSYFAWAAANCVSLLQYMNGNISTEFSTLFAFKSLVGKKEPSWASGEQRTGFRDSFEGTQFSLLFEPSAMKQDAGFVACHMGGSFVSVIRRRVCHSILLRRYLLFDTRVNICWSVPTPGCSSVVQDFLN